MNLSLKGKIVAVTGCTGGLGRELCFELAKQGADLIMLDRNAQKSTALANEITNQFNEVKIIRITTELEDIDSVKNATDRLIELKPNIFVANAGAYSIPRHICKSGYDNVFQINFVSHYYMIRKLHKSFSNIKIVAVGSIAHTYSKINPKDIDFRTSKSSSKTYGNSKRFLMLALERYFKDFPDTLSMVHPGITFTNITAHYPKFVFAIIKYPMKIIFMKPQKAVACIFEGIKISTPFGRWIGPNIFGIWGKPKLQKINASFTQDSKTADMIAKEIYKKLSE